MPYRNPLMYVLVARGPVTPIVPLAEFVNIAGGGEFKLKALQYIQNNIVPWNDTITHKCENLIFNVLVHNDFIYCAVTEEWVGGGSSGKLSREINPQTYLGFVQTKFVEKYGGGTKATTAPAYGLNDEFGPIFELGMPGFYEHYIDCDASEEMIAKEETITKEELDEFMRKRKANHWFKSCW